jgi:hypothetical protein
MDFSRHIAAIVDFKKKFNFGCAEDERVPRKLVGNLGEYYVADALLKNGFEVEMKSGQSGYSLLVAKKIRIEVKTSFFKDEGKYQDGIKCFGWRIQTKDQKNADKFDFLVGIALDDAFEKPEFYVFSKAETANLQEVKLKRFTNILKKIDVFASAVEMEKVLLTDREAVSEYEAYINRHKEFFLNRWDKIRTFKAD